MKIYFDMDGTIANLYAVPDWLPKLRAYNPEPYQQAKPLVNMSRLARYINKLRSQGIEVGIISWLSKESTAEYDEAVAKAKIEWLRQHLPSVTFDTIIIIPHGSPKWAEVAKTANNILFNDERTNVVEWICQGCGYAYTPDKIFEIMRGLLK